jgi:hypothetical protein
MNSKTAYSIVIALMVVTVIVTGTLLTIFGRPNLPRAEVVAFSDFAKNGLGSAGNFITSNMTLMCTVRIGDGTTGDVGVVYLSDGKVRADMTTVGKDGVSSHGSLINDSHYIYTWIAESPDSGLRQEADPSWNILKTATEMYNTGTHMSYSCQPWKRDGSKFYPPDDLVFRDFSAVTQVAPPAQQ